MNARRERNEHRRNAQVERHSARMHRSAAAEGDQREVADVVAARRGDRLDRFFHFGVDDFRAHRRRLRARSSFSGLAIFSSSSFSALLLLSFILPPRK